MKRMKMTQRKIRLTMVLFFSLACFLFSIDVQAQTYPDLIPGGQAQLVLNTEIPTLENVMTNMTPGTPAYTLAERKYNLHVHTLEVLTTGETVEAALTAAFAEFAVGPNGHQADLDELTSITKVVSDYGDPAFNSLVNLLKD